MELALIIIASVSAGCLLFAHLIARRRKCSTAQVVRQPLRLRRLQSSN